MAVPTSRAELADLLCTFLEVSIHTILHARRLYPATLFEQRAAFRCLAWMSRSPEVTECICELLDSIRELLLAGAAEALTIALLPVGGAGPFLEAYTFALTIDAPRVAGTRATYADLEASFGSAIVALQSIESTRAPLPLGATWTAVLATHEEALGVDATAGGAGAAIDAQTPTPWARIDIADDLGTLSAPFTASTPRAARRPIKCVRASSLSIDVSLIEGAREGP